MRFEMPIQEVVKQSLCKVVPQLTHSPSPRTPRRPNFGDISISNALPLRPREEVRQRSKWGIKWLPLKGICEPNSSVFSKLCLLLSVLRSQQFNNQQSSLKRSRDCELLHRLTNSTGSKEYPCIVRSAVPMRSSQTSQPKRPSKATSTSRDTTASKVGVDWSGLGEWMDEVCDGLKDAEPTPRSPAPPPSPSHSTPAASDASARFSFHYSPAETPQPPSTHNPHLLHNRYWQRSLTESASAKWMNHA